MSRITEILKHGLASLVFIDYDRMDNGEEALHKAIDEYVSEREQALLALFNEAIGEDENPEVWHISAVGEKRNELRAEIRKKVGLWAA